MSWVSAAYEVMMNTLIPNTKRATGSWQRARDTDGYAVWRVPRVRTLWGESEIPGVAKKTPQTEAAVHMTHKFLLRFQKAFASRRQCLQNYSRPHGNATSENGVVSNASAQIRFKTQENLSLAFINLPFCLPTLKRSAFRKTYKSF